MYQHKHRAKAGEPSHRSHTIRLILARGAEPVAVVVFRTDDEEAAFTEEKRLIAHYGRENLTNKTDGGDGPSNPPQEVRDRIAAGRRGIKINEVTRQRLRDSHLGIGQREETKRKISATLTGRKAPWATLPRSDEYKANMRESCKGRVNSPETRARISAAKMGHSVSEETRKKISETKRKRNAALRNLRSGG